MSIELVPFEPEHLVKFISWKNHLEVIQGFGFTFPLTSSQVKDHYERVRKDENLLQLAVVENGGEHEECCGLVKFYNIDRVHQKAEIRIIIAPGCQNKGIGTKAIEKACDLAFGRMNLHRMYAYVLDFNTASQKMFEKCGFKKEGILKEDKFSGGKFVDVIMYGRVR